MWTVQPAWMTRTEDTNVLERKKKGGKKEKTKKKKKEKGLENIRPPYKKKVNHNLSVSKCGYQETQTMEMCCAQ